jgi:hypothetical protein
MRSRGRLVAEEHMVSPNCMRGRRSLFPGVFLHVTPVVTLAVLIVINVWYSRRLPSGMLLTLDGWIGVQIIAYWCRFVRIRNVVVTLVEDGKIAWGSNEGSDGDLVAAGVTELFGFANSIFTFQLILLWSLIRLWIKTA